MGLFWVFLLCIFDTGFFFFIKNGKSTTILSLTWCVAKPSSDEATLQANINYACEHVDCSLIKKGCPCFSPESLINHASVVMNLYYQCKGRNQWNCHFGGSGLVTITDPSYSSCVYE
ncbi:hypothetical protein DCAR_0522454 [Daucus carota subsp. sativus]|uniref:X8 domain-containing protein n=1 Tax=Daucus carota subsp. sativus TaxID=79200 RepID=A0AAF0X7X5_DAUCS|nr:hypothetical protein DCAR_0522454 [Daucus carota subsp. sativus]